MTTKTPPPSSSTGTTNTAIISNDVAKQLGKELTEQHPATVLGIARSCITLRSGFHITSTKVKAVRANGLEVSLTCCRGDLCEMKNGFYPLDPPLKSVEEWNGSSNDSSSGGTTNQNRIMLIHQDVCSPKLSWLVTDTASVMILITCAGLAYGVYIGTEEMTELISNNAPRLEQGINTVFGSLERFGYAVHAAFIFANLAHAFEAGIGWLYCNTLRLNVKPTMTWCFMIFLVGFPIFKEIQALVKVQEPPPTSSKKSH